MMNATKPWYRSLGVIGAGTTIITALLTLLKIKVDPQLLKEVSDWTLQVLTLIGGGMALWGRLRASRRITAAPASVQEKAR